MYKIITVATRAMWSGEKGIWAIACPCLAGSAWVFSNKCQRCATCLPRELIIKRNFLNKIISYD